MEQKKCGRETEEYLTLIVFSRTPPRFSKYKEKLYKRNGGISYVDSFLEDPSKVLGHPPNHNVRVNTSSLGLSVIVLDILYLFEGKEHII